MTMWEILKKEGLCLFNILSLAILSSCAQLHQVQIADIDNTKPLKRFDLKVSEMGLDVSEAAGFAKLASRSKGVDQAANTVSDIWKVITYGPKTGSVTFSDSYGDLLGAQLRHYCSEGPITGLMSIRETNKYPVISGEIVRFTGYCIQSKNGNKN